METNNLGSPPLKGLLFTLQPDWWFSAHMHVRFEAEVQHGPSPRVSLPPAKPVVVDNPDEIILDDLDDTDASSSGAEQTASTRINPDEILLDEEEEEVTPAPKPAPPPKATKFLALDKCLPGRKFLEVIDLDEPPVSGPPTIFFDPEWLAITRAFQPLMSLSDRQPLFPDEDAARAMVKTELEWIRSQILDFMAVNNCQKFSMTAHGPGQNDQQDKKTPSPVYRNPQTEAFCEMLKIENKINCS
jgi:lariat debranching enzyme